MTETPKAELATAPEVGVPSKRYSEFSEAEKLAMTSEALHDAIIVEAIMRGIKPPISLTAALAQSEYIGFQFPPQHVVFYEIMAPGSYSSPNATGLCFRTAEQAHAAMLGAVSITEEGYGANKKRRIIEGDFSVRELYITTSSPKTTQARIEEFFQDNTEFDKVAEECTNDIRALRQRDYDRQVTSEKRANYLRLAKGDESIAKAFWDSAERTEWPNLNELLPNESK
jgi:hypothetical protein